MGDREVAPSIAAGLPGQDIEIEHARTPSPPAPPPELGFDRFQRGEQRGGPERGPDERGGVGVAAAARPDRGTADRRRDRDHGADPLRDPIEREGERRVGRPVPAMAPIAAEPDQEGCGGHAPAPIACPMPPPDPVPSWAEPSRDCPLCPRLAAFREAQRVAHPDWHNAPVPVFGDREARIAIVGLAPGLQGANRTGRPFTGDFAGELLYATLGRFGLAEGRFEARPDDGLRLTGAAIVNAVRCVPPQNKPTPTEIATCRQFLTPVLAALPRLRVMVALGRIAHDSVLRASGVRLSAATFGHGVEHALPDGVTLIDSYHCSRYNQNTGLLTTAMFEAAFARAVAIGRGS